MNLPILEAIRRTAALAIGVAVLVTGHTVAAIAGQSIDLLEKHRAGPQAPVVRRVPVVAPLPVTDKQVRAPEGQQLQEPPAPQRPVERTYPSRPRRP